MFPYQTQQSHIVGILQQYVIAVISFYDAVVTLLRLFDPSLTSGI